MEKQKNPYIEPTDYFGGYRESLKEMTQLHSDIVLDELCYEVFEGDEAGKRLAQVMKDRFIYAPTPVQIGDNFDKACVYHEGFRAAFRYLLTLKESYKQRKDFEAKQAEKAATKPKGV